MCGVSFVDVEAANDHANAEHEQKYEYKCSVEGCAFTAKTANQVWLMK